MKKEWNNTMRISVLVPVYGVERYIEECAVSLFEQTYENLEYIFVDDCSPDNSVRILQNVAERYDNRKSQIKIVHHEYNRGLGAARATALDASSGDFVVAVDSDDKLAIDAIETLCRLQQTTGADIVEGTLCRFNENGVFKRQQPYHGTKENLLKLMLLQNTVSHNLAGRLVRRSIYIDNDINSVEGVNMAEDYAVTPRLIYCGSHAYTDEDIYFYRDNTNSSFYESITPRHIASLLKANAIVYQFFQEHDVQGVYQLPLEISMLNTYSQSIRNGIGRKEVDRICNYRPSSLYVRLFRLFFGHCPRLMRFSYLSIKWLYKKQISSKN